MVYQDQLTEFGQLWPLKNKEGGRSWTNRSDFVFSELQSDNGREFENKIINTWKRCGTHQNRSWKASHGQSQGSVEKAN